jgi:hypothetical protein
MWKDNQTGAEYTQAGYDQMQSNPVYKNLVARLVELPSAPAPMDALPLQDSKAEMNENRVDAPTTGKTDRKKG